MPIDIENLLFEFEHVVDKCGVKDNRIQLQDYDKNLYDTIPYINSLLKENEMFHSAIRIMFPRTCLSWHQDPHIRTHIPIITNPGCFMVVEDDLIKMPVGSVHVVDTRKLHTAANTGDKNRWHIVGTVKDEYGHLPKPSGYIYG